MEINYMENIDFSKIDTYSKEQLLQLIKEAEAEYKECSEKLSEYKKKYDKAKSVLYNLSHRHTPNHVFYRNKYIKVTNEFRTTYLYVDYQLFTPYTPEDTKLQLYEYHLHGKGCSKDNISEQYMVSDNIKVSITGQEGELGPHSNSEVEIITKEEFEKAVEEYTRIVTNKTPLSYDCAGSN